MVLRSCALLTPFRQGASHRRKVRNAFNNLEREQALAAPMKCCGLHHFFEAEVMTKLVQLMKVRPHHFTFKKTSTFFAEKSSHVFLKVKYETGILVA
jgi:hypothetical protein